MKDVDFRHAEDVWTESQELLDHTRQIMFSTSRQQALQKEFESAAALLSEMRVELSSLIGQFYKRGDIGSGRGRNRDLIVKINRVSRLLNHLHNDISAVERAEADGQAAFERANTHLQKMAHHCRATRDSLSPVSAENEDNPSD